MSKIKKVEFVKGALDAFPEEDREELTKKLREMFLSGDFVEQSRPIEQLPSGKTECPGCGKVLVAGPVLKIPSENGENISQVFDCFECDRVFSGPPMN